jgi:hypothetical protein
MQNNTMRYFSFSDGRGFTVKTEGGKLPSHMRGGQGCILPSGKSFEFWFGHDLNRFTINPAKIIDLELIEKQ